MVQQSEPPDRTTAPGALPVADALTCMQKAVRSGEIHEARLIGARCVVPLSLTAAEVAMSEKLSEGAESTVFRGRWQGRDVAVKKVRIGTSADLDRFRMELGVLAALSHPAVVPLLGARCLPPDYLLVLPLAAGGSLRELLHERQGGWRPSWGELLALALQVASAMEHVHGAGYLHRDLKPANLLLADPRASALQIADFGLAVHDPEAQEAEEQGTCEEQGGEAGAEQEGAGGEGGRGGSTGQTRAAVRAHGKPTGGFHKRDMVGTLEYMAPELLLRTAPHSRASDVYAFGVVLNEMATGIIPFSDCTKDNPEVHTVLEMGYGRQELAAAVCAEGLRPLMPKRCPAPVAALLHACWEKDPAARPSFAQVRQALEGMAAAAAQWGTPEGQQWPGAAAGEGAKGVEVQGGEEGTSGAAGRGQVAVVEAMAVDGPEGVGAQGGAGEGAAAGAGAGAGARILPPFVLCPCEDDAAWVAAGGAQGGGEAAMEVDGGAATWLQQLLRQTPVAGSGGTDGNSTSWPIFNAGGFEAIGPRDSQEDRHLVLDEHTLLPHHHQQQQQRAAQHAAAPHAAPNGASAASGVQHAIDGAAHAPAEGALHPGSSAAAARAGAPLVASAAVLDGHRGSEAAEFCARRLPELLRRALAAHAGEGLTHGPGGDGVAGAAAALRGVFLQLEDEYRRHWEHQRQVHAHLARGPHAFPGACALVALLVGRQLLLANAGDCRAVLCRGRAALAGTRDHTGLLRDERERLERAGVAVTWQHGGWRVGATGLQVTRCIGDFDVKHAPSAAGEAGGLAGPAAAAHGSPRGSAHPHASHAAGQGAVPAAAVGAGACGLAPGGAVHAAGGGGASPAQPHGVTAAPEVTTVQLGPHDHFLILATDGLWDVVSVQEAVGLVYDTVKDPVLASKRLVTEALMRGSADNVTAVVVFLTAAHGTLERVYGAGEGQLYEVTGTAYGSRTRMAKDRHAPVGVADELRDTY